MTIDDQPVADTPGGVDRRAALKKAAIAAGVVAWTTPVVQAVTARPVHAATVTACSPVVTGTATLTGPGCVCTPQVPNPSCCDANTYIITGAVANCGPTCLGTVAFDIISIATVLGAKPGCPPIFESFRRLACLGGTGQVQFTLDVTCPDGTFFDNIVRTVPVTCIECAGATTAAAAEEDFLPESLDVTEETLPAGKSVPPEVSLPPEAPPPTDAPPVNVPPTDGTVAVGADDTGTSP